MGAAIFRVFVIGGAGYIGSHTVVALFEAGHDVAVQDNHFNSSADVLKQVEEIAGKKCIVYKVDAADGGHLAALMADIQQHSRLHFAG